MTETMTAYGPKVIPLPTRPPTWQEAVMRVPFPACCTGIKVELTKQRVVFLYA